MPLPRIPSTDAISKSELHQLFRAWQVTSESQIGPSGVDGRTRWIHIVDNGALFSLHADATHDGVAAYLDLVRQFGEELTWSVRPSSRAVVFGPDALPVSHLYLYLENAVFKSTWRAAVRRALRRYSARNRTRRIVRQLLIDQELDRVLLETRAEGDTPAQTMSRVLQELREEGLLVFVDAGEYLLNDGPIDIGAEELPEETVDVALLSGLARFNDVDASEFVALTRQRLGQARLRKLCLELYGSECAFCGVKDPRLLTASHVVRWADDDSLRGNLCNVICMCRMHDALYEIGAFVLSNELQPIVVANPADLGGVAAHTLRATTIFRHPISHVPSEAVVARHRMRCGYEI